ncbi:EAL domain-containing protein [Notoacmeibacter ruber]|uniref:EAL domain-containing protein n=1 Tax=Notoacmeibacter ruber TaxID=2670375 RepID=A0A3L7J755_9HYPH|nr:EAL domain-containing protein [Notoacmeibacter ruber]RLQ85281.1 EAL domain-containing protein [Notoacmeibacter ruber]
MARHSAKRALAPVAPGDFIPIAEASDLIVPIGAWIIRQACRTTVDRLNDATISVKVSPRQFRDPNLLSNIRTALDETGLPPSRLELEITEGILIDDDQLALRLLSTIRQLGIRIALDDFGSGYSSLSYLTRFCFDTIKIDRSFVQSTDEKAWHVIRSVVSMAEALGASVVAEGVETAEQMHRLASEGCHEIQGFFIARPTPVDEISPNLPADAQHALLAIQKKRMVA